MRDDESMDQKSRSRAEEDARAAFEAKSSSKISPVASTAIKILIGSLLAVGAEVAREKIVHAREEKEPEKRKQTTQEEMKESGLKDPSRRSVHVMRWASLAIALVVIGVVTLLALGKLHGHSKKETDLKAQVAKGPQLEVVALKKAPLSHDLILEAESRPYYQTTIFAKVSGYLRDIRVIEGSRLKLGDIIGVIDSPETDQAYESARADAINKNRVAARSRILLRQRLISAQEAEQAFAESRMATAQLRSAKEQKEYETLRAPFDGIVTSRLVDPGALIPNASNAKSAQLAVVNMAATGHLKIDAFIEQRYAADIYVGMPVQIYLPDRASEKFPAQVARVSGVLDPRTRMLFIEMDFDNSAGRIVAGSFVSVTLKVRRPELLQAPIQALVSKDNSPALASLGADKKIKLVPIQIYENDGTNVMISSGATEGMNVVLDVGAELKDGDAIQPIFSDKGAQQGGPKQQQASSGAAPAQGSQAQQQPQSQQAQQMPPPIPQNGSNEAAQTASSGSSALANGVESQGTVSATTQPPQLTAPQVTREQMSGAQPSTYHQARDPRSTPEQYAAFSQRPPPPPTPTPAPQAPQPQAPQQQKDSAPKQKGTTDKPAPLEKTSTKKQPQQQGGGSKNKTDSGESQPKLAPQKSSMSNGVFLPPNPPEANE